MYFNKTNHSDGTKDTLIGSYKGRRVIMTMIGDIQVGKQELHRDIKLMQDLLHGNICKFVGICFDSPFCSILMEYESRGSVQSLILDPEIRFSWDMKISLIVDIASGMKYLHNSKVGFHGQLTSWQCVVDHRWICKVTGYGLRTLRTPPMKYDHNNTYNKLFWASPEVLANQHASLSVEQKAVDIYSYGIILQEIILECPPYGENRPPLAAEQIVDGVKRGTRPFIPINACSEGWRKLMTDCWKEDSNLRPSFGQILHTVKHLNNGKLPSLIDSILICLEEHTKALEVKVGDRTRELHVEKTKVEQLLYELLPKSVAESLKMGKTVEPEMFENSTIFMSDIVGFTRISSKATPMQIVVMLNEMYTLFDDITCRYDVYKVATIGDGYMVASGLPIRNGDKHAREITNMAKDLLGASRSFVIGHMKQEVLKLRIGIHSGPCVGGVTGIKMPRYLLFGDTIEIATKMESSGEPMRIHISEATYKFLRETSLELSMGEPVSLKGGGRLNTYWID